MTPPVSIPSLRGAHIAPTWDALAIWRAVHDGTRRGALGSAAVLLAELPKMNLVYGLLVSVFVLALGDRGDPKMAGVVAPLQVAGVAAGAAVLVAGGAAI